MLTKLDDYPVHQSAEPLAQAVTTDRHAYDRYWFNGYADDASFYFGIALARYPNLGILDCALSVLADGEQHSFYASRRAPLEPTELRVGPFRLDIIEPMQRLRVTLDDNESGVAGELEWLPRTAHVQESLQRHRRRVGTMEATRCNQFGRWRGNLRFGGHAQKLDAAHVLGTKDRSWGLRPVGDPAPPGAPPTPGGVFFLWAPLHWAARCTHMSVFENEHGWPWHFDGMICPAYENPDDIPGVEDPRTELLAAGEHRIAFAPGTRRASHAQIALLRNDGAREEIELEPALCFRMKGLGYLHPEWGHGRWKGELAVGGERWKCAELDELALPNLHIQQVVRAKSGDARGIGVLEQIHVGPHARYGFRELLDGARAEHTVRGGARAWSAKA